MQLGPDPPAPSCQRRNLPLSGNVCRVILYNRLPLPRAGETARLAGGERWLAPAASASPQHEGLLRAGFINSY